MDVFNSQVVVELDLFLLELLGEVLDGLADDFEKLWAVARVLHDLTVEEVLDDDGVVEFLLDLDWKVSVAQ